MYAAKDLSSVIVTNTFVYRRYSIVDCHVTVATCMCLLALSTPHACAHPSITHACLTKDRFVRAIIAVVFS